MVDIQHKRLEIRRERVGLQEEGLRGVNAVPASVEEALERLRQLEDSQAEFHKKQQKSARGDQGDEMHKKKSNTEKTMSAKQARAENNRRELRARKIWKEGVLVHRTEPELKTHTSYLVFAVLPMEWTEEDEKAAAREWSYGVINKLNGSSGQRDSS
jgi:tRNA (adenine57-N1/adenine58-N1)-methyltransferase